MTQIYAVQIKGGSNNDKYLVKYHKGYDTSDEIGLQNMFHLRESAVKAAEGYIKECEYGQKRLNEDKEMSYVTTEYYRKLALQGRSYVVKTFNLVEVK